MLKRHEVSERIERANPVSDRVLKSPGPDAWQEMVAGIVAEPRDAAEPNRTGPLMVRFHANRRLRPALCGLVSMCAIAAALLGVGLRSTGSPAPALGAGLGQLARVSPHLLLDSEGWQVEAGYRVDHRAGVIRFFHGPREFAAGPKLGGSRTVSAVPTAVLSWKTVGSNEGPHSPAPGANFVGVQPALATKAWIYVVARRDGERRFYAVWNQAGRQLQLRASTQSLSAFEAMLASLRSVSRSTWLAVLPDRLVHRGGWFLTSS